MASSSPAASSSCGRRRPRWPEPVWPAPRRPLRTRRRRTRWSIRPMTAPAGRPVRRAGPTRRAPQARGQRADERRHAALERPEERRPVGSGGGTSARRARMRPPRRSRPPTMAGTSRRRTCRRPSRRGCHRSTDPPRCRRHAGPACAPRGGRWNDRRSVPGRRAAGRTASRARPSRPRTPTMPERAVGQNRVGIPSTCPSGSARRRPRAQTTHPGPRRARASRRSPPGGTGRRPRADGPGTRRGPGRRRARRSPRSAGPAEARRRLEQGDRGRVRAGARPTGQLPGRGQAADAAADDDHRRGAASGARRRRRSGRPARR